MKSHHTTEEGMCDGRGMSQKGYRSRGKVSGTGGGDNLASTQEIFPLFLVVLRNEAFYPQNMTLSLISLGYSVLPYLGLVQSPQRLEQVAKVAADAVQVLKCKIKL